MVPSWLWGQSGLVSPVRGMPLWLMSSAWRSIAPFPAAASGAFGGAANVIGGATPDPPSAARIWRLRRSRAGTGRARWGMVA